jgi:hypothetical protein
MAHLSEPKVVFNNTNAFQEGPRTVDKQKIHGEGQIWNDGVDITQFVSSTKLFHDQLSLDQLFRFSFFGNTD